MSTATISPGLDPVALPVEINPAEEDGKVWLEQAGQLPILAVIKNDWQITEAPDGRWPRARAPRSPGQEAERFRRLVLRRQTHGWWSSKIAEEDTS